MSNKKYIFSFSEEEIQKLNDIISNGKPNTKLVTRAKILLVLNESVTKPMTTEEIATLCNTTHTTVQTVRKQYSLEGFDAALYPPKREKPPVLPKTNGIEDKVIALISTTPPKGRKKWSEQLLAEQCVALGYVDNISHTSIHRFLKANNISLINKK